MESPVAKKRKVDRRGSESEESEGEAEGEGAGSAGKRKEGKQGTRKYASACQFCRRRKVSRAREDGMGTRSESGENTTTSEGGTTDPARGAREARGFPSCRRTPERSLSAVERSLSFVKLFSPPDAHTDPLADEMRYRAAQLHQLHRTRRVVQLPTSNQATASPYVLAGRGRSLTLCAIDQLMPSSRACKIK